MILEPGEWLRTAAIVSSPRATGSWISTTTMSHSPRSSRAVASAAVPASAISGAARPVAATTCRMSSRRSARLSTTMTRKSRLHPAASTVVTTDAPEAGADGRWRRSSRQPRRARGPMAVMLGDRRAEAGPGPRVGGPQLALETLRLPRQVPRYAGQRRGLAGLSFRQVVGTGSGAVVAHLLWGQAVGGS